MKSVIGNGDIAKVLHARDGCIMFASGVSNSQCQDEAQYDREKHLLRQFYGSRFSLFYFSSISIYTVISRYTQHKVEMEQLIRDHFENYNVIRLGNIDWGTNPNTFINYLKAHPEAPIKDEFKHMITKEQLTLITDNLPAVGKNEISIFGEMKRVKDCL